MAEHPDQTAEWDVVYDARGHFAEPHTERLISLGTINVRGYTIYGIGFVGVLLGQIQLGRPAPVFPDQSSGVYGGSGACSCALK